jgi:hypothetical protein
MPAPLGGRARAEARLRAKQKVKVKPKAKPKSYTLPRSFSTERAASPKVKAPRKSPSKGAGSGYRLPKDFRPADTGTDNIRLAGKKAKRDVRTGSVTWRKEMRSVGRGGKLRVKRRTETNRDVNTAIHRIRQRQAFKQLNDYAAEQVGSKKKPDYAGAKRLRKVVTREATGMNRRIQAEEARQRKAARDRERAAARRIKVFQDREKEERSGGGVGGRDGEGRQGDGRSVAGLVRAQARHQALAEGRDQLEALRVGDQGRRGHEPGLRFRQARGQGQDRQGFQGGREAAQREPGHGF